MLVEKVQNSLEPVQKSSSWENCKRATGVICAAGLPLGLAAGGTALIYYFMLPYASTRWGVVSPPPISPVTTEASSWGWRWMQTGGTITAALIVLGVAIQQKIEANDLQRNWAGFAP